MTTIVNTTDQAVARSMTFLKAILKDYHPRNFAVRLWDGSEWPAETDSPHFTLVPKHPARCDRCSGIPTLTYR